MEKEVKSQDYMTTSEVAKKMGVTIHTLQYYDKIGILSPPAVNKGGARFYTHKEIVKLFLIRYMKSLGFSLDDIKTRLPPIETPDDVIDALTAHSTEIKGNLTALNDVLVSIKELKNEIEKMETVDWGKYADIAVSLQARLMYLKIRRQAN